MTRGSVQEMIMEVSITYRFALLVFWQGCKNSYRPAILYWNVFRHFNKTCIIYFGYHSPFQYLISHKVLDSYPRISFISKGLSTVQKLHVRCESFKKIDIISN